MCSVQVCVLEISSQANKNNQHVSWSQQKQKYTLRKEWKEREKKTVQKRHVNVQIATRFESSL